MPDLLPFREKWQTKKFEVKVNLGSFFPIFFSIMAHASLRLLPLLKIIFWEELFYVCMYYENHNFQLINFLFLHFFFAKKKKKNVSSPFFLAKNKKFWKMATYKYTLRNNGWRCYTRVDNDKRERECQFHESMYHVGSTTQATLTYIGRQAALKDQQMARHCNK